MKIIHVAAGLNNEAAGTTTTVLNYAKYLARTNQVTVVNLGTAAPIPATYNLSCFPVHGGKANIMMYSSAFNHYLLESSAQCDILHVHGLWKFSNIYATSCAKKNKCKLVVSPHGTLFRKALQRSAWKKKIFNLLGHYKALQQADMLLATSVAEYESIRAANLHQPVMILPLGIDCRHVSTVSKKPNNLRRLTYLGRLDPIKNIDMMIRCWSRLALEFPDWEFVIVGPQNNCYFSVLQNLARKLNCPRLRFEAALFGNSKLDFLNQSDLFVLASQSENFGLTILEALGERTPVVVTQNAPWQIVNEYHCGWSFFPSEDIFLQTLRTALSTSPEILRQMGESGRQLVEQQFSWMHVVECLQYGYEWLCHGGMVPDNIQMR